MSRLLTEEEIKLVAHTKDTRIGEDECVIEDNTTHNPSWIDEMLQFGMSVFEAVAKKQDKVTVTVTLKRVAELLKAGKDIDQWLIDNLGDYEDDGTLHILHIQLQNAIAKANKGGE